MPAMTRRSRTRPPRRPTDRKIYEAKCALKLEQEYTKDQILEQYFNIAFFGEQSYGIDVAALNYFGHRPRRS